MSATTTAESCARLILYHKHHTSARTRFLRIGDTVCTPAPLPTLAQTTVPVETPVLPHPGVLLGNAERLLNLAAGELELEREFRQMVDVPGGPVTVFLARITTIDPPFDDADSVGGRFIALTEARDLAPTELELLREAYTLILGG